MPDPYMEKYGYTKQQILEGAGMVESATPPPAVDPYVEKYGHSKEDILKGAGLVSTEDPVTQAAPPPVQPEKKSLFSQAADIGVGTLETIPAFASGVTGFVAGQAVKVGDIGRRVVGGQPVGEAIREAARPEAAGSRVAEALTYKPRTESARGAVELLAKPFELYRESYIPFAERTFGAGSEENVELYQSIFDTALAVGPLKSLAKATVRGGGNALMEFKSQREGKIFERIQKKHELGEELNSAEQKFIFDRIKTDSPAFKKVLEEKAKMDERGMTMKEDTVVSDTTIAEMAKDVVEGNTEKVTEHMRTLKPEVDPQEVAHNVQMKAGEIVEERAKPPLRIMGEAEITEKPAVTVEQAKGMSKEQLEKLGMDELGEHQSPTVETSGRIKGIMDVLSEETGAIDLSKFDPAPTMEALGLPDPTTAHYKSAFDMIEDWRIGRNMGARAAFRIREKLAKELTPESRKKISHYLEGKDIPLTEAELSFANKLRDVYGLYRERLKAEGILETFHDDYVNHVIRGTKSGRGMGGKLGSRPTFTRKRVIKEDGSTYTIEELKKKGLDVEEDISLLMSLYIHTAEKALANRALVSGLKNLTLPDGTKAIMPLSKIPPELQGKFKKLSETNLKKWTGRKIKEGETALFQQEIGIHKDVWDLVDNIARDEPPPGLVYRAYTKFRGGVKRVIMFNPLIHGFNVESNVAMALGGKWVKDVVTGRRFRTKQILGEEGYNKVLDEMVERGVELEGLYDISKRITYDVINPELSREKTSPGDIAKDPIETIVKHPWRTLTDIGDTVLWDRMVKSGQVTAYMTLKERFIADGLTELEAGRSAANMVNDLLGTLPHTWFTRTQRKALFNLMFARNWTVSNLRTVTGALGAGAKSRFLPKPLRFEGLNDKQLKAMGKQYRGVLLKGVVMAYTSANIVQSMLLAAQGKEQHFTFQNEEGHTLDIDTGMVDGKGRRVYLKNWMFRQIDDYAKLISSTLEGRPKEFFLAKMEPVLRTLMEYLANANFQGRPVIPRGATAKQKMVFLGKHIIRGVTPLDTFVNREDETMSIFERFAPLTGTWIRHGMPAGGDPRAGDMLKAYYEHRARKEVLSDEDKNEVSRLIQQGRDDEALAIVNRGNLTYEQVSNINKRLKDPLRYRIGGIEGGLDSDFMEFLFLQDEETQAEYEDALGNNLMPIMEREIQGE